MTERPGWLRLKTNRVVSSLYLAPNTLTQRMEGPTCSAAVKVDVSHLKDGDCAGFAAFNDETGALIIKKKSSRLSLEMATLSVKLSQKDKVVENVDEKTIESIDLSKPKTQNGIRTRG